MAAYKIKLRRSDEVAEGTTAVYFEKPEGFQFKTGQFLRFTMIDPADTKLSTDCDDDFGSGFKPAVDRRDGAHKFRDAVASRRSLKAAVYYIAGPQGLVSAMQKILGEAGVSEGDIRAEQFTGY